MKKALLHTKSLLIGHSSKALLQPMNIDIMQGQLVGIKGRNGKGKTTLLRTIAGLLQPISGEIFINDKNLLELTIPERARLVSIVTTERSRLNGITVDDLVEMGRYPVTGRYSFRERKNDPVIDETIRTLGLENIRSKTLSEISDGELQKAMIARALAQQTPLILMDEPTAFLDYIAKEELFQLLKKLTQSGKYSVIFTSHDIEMMQRFADETISI